MNKLEFIKGLNTVIEGLTAIRDAIGNVEQETAPAEKPRRNSDPASSVKKPSAPGKETMPVPVKEDPAAGGSYTKEELSRMKYNEFKKLASRLGVDCKGTRDEIMERVIALGVVTDGEGSSEPDSAQPAAGKKVPAKSGGVKGLGKGNTPNAGKNARDEFDEKAEEVAKETSYEEVLEALESVGLRATKINYKKQLAKAFREGLIEVGEDEESGGDNEELSPEDYYSGFDVYGVNNPDSMEDDRKSACVQLQSDILNSISSGELDSDTIVDFLQNNATQDELDLLGDEYTDNDLVKLYVEVRKHFIDGDGEEHSPGEAYMVGDSAFCCGKPLDYDEVTGKFLCSHCASEYEAGE